ncbi:cation-translocating P-type ATPase [Ruminococcus sp.]|uniref:cation-translocating P-type ATPase n=1 Tax=Ruminococcus sp. TaxID=41978 RepID=UPI0025D9E8D7|nr:cation-translocating P-type ATPase [Ruminococcus sp.]MBQ8967628.1 cation-translocating P-type ATPase [Ruminococcus sp.]
MSGILDIALDASQAHEPPRETRGLTSAEAEHRRRTQGANTLGGRKKKGALKIFAGQFHDVMVMILLGATVVSVLLGQYRDAIPMVAVVIINAFLGFIQEYRCEKTLEKLEEMTAPSARVYRDGRLVKLPAERLVCGDVYTVEAGDRIPADGYIIECRGFCCDESILTGEAEPAVKRPRRDEVDFSSLNKDHMAYMGTVVTKGTAVINTTAIGKSTQMGRVSVMLNSIDEELTPLQKKLAELGRTLAVICIVICFIVFIAGLLQGEPLLDMAMTGITIAIAAIPEGLPAAVTIALSLAVRKMLKRNALVHRLHSVETLGCASVICTDKTGTITQNKMKVTAIADSTGKTYDISSMAGASSENMKELLTCGVLCCNAVLEEVPPSLLKAKNSPERFTAQGDPTECAIAVAAAELGIRAEDTVFTRTDEIPFDSESRSMTVVCRDPSGNVVSFRKGSADVIINECSLALTDNGTVSFGSAEKMSLLRAGDRLAAEGLRVLAFSEVRAGKAVFLGLMGMQDPLRPEAAAAVRQCERAGIRTVMITGDHKLTASAIAREAGIMKQGSLILTGSELDAISDEKLADIIDNCSVFARVTPAHKLRIVRAFKAKGHICAMTGDGVNDAPAVKEADIGVSMGIQGTEVTKQAADIILLDDDFATLVSAVEDGRTIYSNIRKFVRYMISSNIGEVVTMFGGILMGLPMVMLPAQILLVNLVTDSLPAVALGLEPAEKTIMERRPRKENDSFFSGGLLWRMLLRGLLIGICTLGTFSMLLKGDSSLQTARTGALITLVLSQLIHVFECKSEEKTLFSVPYFNNGFLLFAVITSAAALFAGIYVPLLGRLFSTAVPDLRCLLVSVGSAFLVPVLSGLANSAKKLRRNDTFEIPARG